MSVGRLYEAGFMARLIKKAVTLVKQLTLLT